MSVLFPAKISEIVGLPMTDIDANAKSPEANKNKLMSA